ncbi:MAG: hypothetical protein NTU41_07410 [Chloroflexi bacterium]|nr:hypothetical protein [Chloroflexota bacterium]
MGVKNDEPHEEKGKDGEMSPEEAFELLKKGILDGVPILLKHWRSLWMRELMSWILKRLEGKKKKKQEMLEVAGDLAKKLFLSACREVCTITLHGNLNGQSLEYADELVGLFLKYWLLNAVMRGDLP